MSKIGKRSFVADLSLVLACSLFLLVVVQPVLTLSRWAELDFEGMGSPAAFLHADFYSFKSDYLDRSDLSSSFGDYWFGNESWKATFSQTSYWRRYIQPLIIYDYSVWPVPTLLFFIFLIEVLTPILGFVTLLMKAWKRLIPLVLCLVAFCLMTWSYLTIYSNNVLQAWSLSIGYWLTFVSFACFLISFIFAVRAAHTSIA